MLGHRTGVSKPGSQQIVQSQRGPIMRQVFVGDETFSPAEGAGQEQHNPRAAGTQKPRERGTGCPHTQHSTLGAGMCLLLPSIHPTSGAGDQPQHPRMAGTSSSRLGGLAARSSTWLSSRELFKKQQIPPLAVSWTEGKGWNNKCALATSPLAQGNHGTAAKLEPNTKYSPPLFRFSHGSGFSRA